MKPEKIKEIIDKDKVVLFMKGTREFPQCGFSKQVITILENLEVKYQEYDVLANPELRENIKEFSDWPTIPQLYVNGEFIGGSDIVYDMYRDDELDSVFSNNEES
jgi:monothiol glutaredoxin